MTWFRGSIARLPISLSSIRKAWATSIAEPSWVKVAPASKLQLTSMLKVTMSWYEMHTLDAWSAAIHSRSSPGIVARSEEHTSELQSRVDLVCRLLLEKKKNTPAIRRMINVRETP